MSSDLSTGWSAPSVEQTLTRLRNVPLKEVADAHLPRIESGVPQVQRDTDRQPTTAQSKSSGLKVRLLIVDVTATVGTWLVLGTYNMPAMTAIRQWGAALAATAVTLAAMQLLGLYRSRLCVQRGQEKARIVVAAVAGAVSLELLRGDGDRSYTAAIVAAGSCILALMTLRWMFREWLRTQRARDTTAEGSS